MPSPILSIRQQTPGYRSTANINHERQFPAFIRLGKISRCSIDSLAYLPSMLGRTKKALEQVSRARNHESVYAYKDDIVRNERRNLQKFLQSC